MSDEKSTFKKFINGLILLVVGGVLMFFISKFLVAPFRNNDIINKLQNKIAVIETRLEESQKYLGEINALKKALDENQLRIEKIEADRFQIQLKVRENFVKNPDTDPIKVSGRPIVADVIMRSSQKDISGYYVHIFHIESGVGKKYYYQGSTYFSTNQAASIPLYLGRPGDIDLNKTYQIYAIVNRTQKYEKVKDIYAVKNLPNNPVTSLTVERVE